MAEYFRTRRPYAKSRHPKSEIIALAELELLMEQSTLRVEESWVEDGGDDWILVVEYSISELDMEDINDHNSAHDSESDATQPIEEDSDDVPTGTKLKPPKNSRKFSKLSEEYQLYFDLCHVRPSKSGLVDRMADKLVANKLRYDEIEKKTSVPWFFAGAIHLLESGGHFGTHLHNGDPLNNRTVRVPAGRPSKGSPPFTWVESAVDAIRLKKLHRHKRWSVPNLLYRWEAYNGFGYRPRGIATPYLWSFSNHYSKGKFVKDGVFDEDAVSKQCGAAVLLRRLLDRGDVVV